MKYLVLSAALLLAACDLKVKAKEPAAPAPPAKPVCARSLTKDIPQAFQQAGTAVGAVKTEACETLVVGHDTAGAVILGRYDIHGAPVDVTKPLGARFSGMNVKVQRLAVINDGFFALGSHGKAGETRALFAFRFLDSGFLDLGYGPLRDGTARAASDGRYDLISVLAVSVEGELIRLRLRAEDLLIGTEADVERVILVNGAQTMEKDLRPVPPVCDLLTHDTVKQSTAVQIAQSACAAMSFRSSGAFGSDALTVAMDGTVYFSNFLGDMRWYYEGRTPVLVSRDSLGFTRREYAAFVQGQTSICGTTVDARRRYLVFSPRPPAAVDWLANCWFM